LSQFEGRCASFLLLSSAVLAIPDLLIDPIQASQKRYGTFQGISALPPPALLLLLVPAK
jgi:hypothetical protein